MIKHFLSLVAIILVNIIFAQSIDVKKYQILVKINDSTDLIQVTEVINAERLTDSKYVELDLVGRTSNEFGMKVSEAQINGNPVTYEQKGNLLNLILSDALIGASNIEIKLSFSGIPEDGLIIGKNKFGNRTFFGDNWPNRASYWFACNDHPLDKALVDFSIIAPQHYKVVANGEFKGTVDFGTGFKVHSYSSRHELPTKVMVFGAAEFSVEQLTEFTRFPLSSWVYPENEKAGFHDMKMAIPVLNFLEEHIAPYPYEKLANVQSTTKYGGMENAGCIFYSERSITGKDMMEELIAHEIAHQWFGNSATETDWSHLWLSEGFATYMTHLYIENKYGKERFEDELKKDRQTVLHFYQEHVLPLVDTISTDPVFMLNTNPYQRGAWVLHMLRNEIGNDMFWKSIRNYYSTYKYGNATTQNFIDIVEQVSGKDLSTFEKQWMRTAEIPELDLLWKQKGKTLNISLKQTQKNILFQIPVEYLIIYTDGTQELKTVQILNTESLFNTKTSKKVKSIELDPNVKLLFRR